MKEQVTLYSKDYDTAGQFMNQTLDSSVFYDATNWGDIVTFSSVYPGNPTQVDFLYNLQLQITRVDSNSPNISCACGPDCTCTAENNCGCTCYVEDPCACGPDCTCTAENNCGCTCYVAGPSYTVTLYLGTTMIGCTTGIDPSAVSTMVYISYMNSNLNQSNPTAQFTLSNYPVQVFFLKGTRTQPITLPISAFTTDLDNFYFSIASCNIVGSGYAAYSLTRNSTTQQWIPAFRVPKNISFRIFSCFGGDGFMKYTDQPATIGPSAAGFSVVTLGAQLTLEKYINHPLVPTMSILFQAAGVPETGALLGFTTPQNASTLTTAALFPYGSTAIALTSLSSLSSSVVDLSTFHMGSLSGLVSDQHNQYLYSSGSFYMHPSNNWAVPLNVMIVDTLVVTKLGPLGTMTLYELAFSNYARPIEGIVTRYYFYVAL